MADVDIPTYRDLMLPTLVAVRDLGGSASVAELEEVVPQVAGVTDEQLAVEFPPGANFEGKSKVWHRLHWARTYLKKIGALENSQRGVWAMTPVGLEYLDMPPAEADTLLRQADNRVRAEMRQARAGAEEHEEATDEEAVDWSDELLSIVKQMEPAAFERLAMRLLREAGFRNVEVTGRSGDGGIDGVGVYRISLVSFPTYFQCKRYKGSVGPEAVRDFRGAMAGRGEKGLIITTGTFTPAAKAEATRDGAPPIDLIEGDDLCDLLKKYRLGVDVVERVEEDIIVRADYFESV